MNEHENGLSLDELTRAALADLPDADLESVAGGKKPNPMKNRLVATRTDRLSKVALNPQPLPPRN